MRERRPATSFSWLGGRLAGMAEPGIGWLRVLGYGICWADSRRHPPLYSDRQPWAPLVNIGRWRLALRERVPYHVLTLREWQIPAIAAVAKESSDG